MIKNKNILLFLFLTFSYPLNLLAQTSQDALHRAIQIGEAEIAITLLQSYPKEKINYPVTRQGGTFLHEVVQRHYRSRKLDSTLRLIDALIKYGIDVNRRDDQSRTALFYARGEDAAQIIGHLLKHGADYKLVDIRGKSVLHVYAEQGNKRLVEYFLNKGLPVDIKDKKGITPIMDAARRGKWDVVDIFIKKGANTKVADNAGNTLLHYAAMSRNFNIVDHLLELGLPINAKNNRGETVLSIFARARKWSVVRVLLERGADPNVPMNYNQSLALYLLLNPELGMSKFISKDKVDVNMRSPSGTTPAMDAINRLDLPLLKKLVALGAKLDVSPGDRYSPVSVLAGRDPKRYPKALEMLKYLIAHGVNVNATVSSRHYPPIMIAASRGYMETVKVLMKAGADLKPYKGQTVVGVALLRKQYDMAKMFLDAGVRPDFSQYNAWRTVQMLAREVEAEEAASTKGAATEMFVRIMDLNPVVDWSTNTRSGYYIERILSKLEKSQSKTVQSNLKKIKHVHPELRMRYQRRHYSPGRRQGDVIRNMVPFFQ